MAYTNGKKVLHLCGTEAVYVSCEFLMRYLTGFAAENGAVIVDKNGTTLYTDRRYIEAAEKLFAGTDVTPSLAPYSEIMKRLAEYESVGISYRHTSHAGYLALEKAGAKLDSLNPLAILAREYGAAFDKDGRVIKSIDQIQKGEAFTLRLSDGEMEAQKI